MVLMMRHGFTLVELLIVMVILGILATIAIPAFSRTKQQADRALMQSDLRVLATAEDAYFADSLSYGLATSCDYPVPPGQVFWCVSAGNTLGIITIGTGGRAGWTANITNKDTGTSCAIYIGTVTPAAPERPGDQEGVPVCR